MKQYTISINDDIKAGQLLSFLSDLYYVKVVGSPEIKEVSALESKKYLLMNNPFFVDDFKLFNREELHER